MLILPLVSHGTLAFHELPKMGCWFNLGARGAAIL